MSKSLDPFEEFRRKQKQGQQVKLKLKLPSETTQSETTQSETTQSETTQSETTQSETDVFTRDRFESVVQSDLEHPEGFEDHRLKSTSHTSTVSKPDLFQKF